MTYSSALSSIARTPISICVITLDYCGNTFGTAPCTATGVKCFNTWPTCKDRANFDRQEKDYKFSSSDAPLPIKVPTTSGVWGDSGFVWGSSDSTTMWGFGWQAVSRPYLLTFDILPTDISGDVTITAEATIMLADEPDNDVGIDPYLATRASIPITSFWKKLISRNSNYKNRYLKIYDGFSDMKESDFIQRFIGKISTIGIDGAEVTIESSDLLVTLDDYEMPQKLEIELVNDITIIDTTIVLASVDGLDYPSGYIRIADEVVYYADTIIDQNTLLGCVRGAYNTVAAEASSSDKVQKCKLYRGNPFDLLQQILVDDAGIPSEYIDSASFNYWRDFPARDIDFDSIITEPTSLKTLFWEIVNVLDLKVWVAEDLKITCTRAMQNAPGRTYTNLTDSQHIINDSTGLDTNDASAITRCSIYYHQTPVGKVDETAAFQRGVIAINGDNENENGFKTIIEQKFLCRWVSARYQQEEIVANWVTEQAARILFRYAAAMPIVTFDVELKDQDLKTGTYVKMTTDELLDIYGNPVNDFFTVTSRTMNGINRITYTALFNSRQRFAFYAPDGISDYATATDIEKEYGYYCNDNGYIGDNQITYNYY
jgi:hypothetical protein